MEETKGSGFYRYLAKQSRDKAPVLTQRQEQLSRTHLDSIVDGLFALMLDIRDSYDKHFRRNMGDSLSRIKKPKSSHIRSVHSYPKGYCDVIIDNIFSMFMEQEEYKNLLNKGIIVKRLFGIMDSSCTHHAIQIGDYLFDMAHDALDTNSEKAAYFPLKNADFKQIEWLHQRIDIDMKYHRTAIIPNTYFPGMSMLYPYFELNKEDNYMFLNSINPAIILDNFRNGLDEMAWLFEESDFSSNTLPQEFSAKMAEVMESVKPRVSKSLKNSFPELFFIAKDRGEFFRYFESVKSLRSRVGELECFDSGLISFASELAKTLKERMSEYGYDFVSID